MVNTELKPCPFCGGEAFKEAFDRLITIGCRVCNYYMSFHGVVQSEINTGKPVIYTGGEVSEHEWYDQFAHERAAEKWNRRAENGNL